MSHTHTHLHDNFVVLVPCLSKASKKQKSLPNESHTQSVSIGPDIPSGGVSKEPVKLKENLTRHGQL